MSAIRADIHHARVWTTAVLVLLLAACASQSARAQAYPGYTLFNATNSKTTYLIDMQGSPVHTWTNALSGGYATYLLENGLLLRPALNPGNQLNVPAGSGRIQKIDWNSNVVWEYTYSSSKYVMHHDVEPLPNGNVLLIAYEVKTASEASAAGRQTAVTMWPDHIVEVQPIGSNGGSIVWEWHAWDHLVQDKFPTRANYGVVAQHPELININLGTVSLGGDWMHVNAVSYNPDLDLIAFTSHYFNEVYVIDHGTTTAEAAGHSGGRRGKGGDILYRWGKPSNYGAPGSAVFDVVHCAWWIPSGLPGAGHLLAFNNRNAARASMIVELTLPMDGSGNFTLAPGTAYGPTAPSWTYSDGSTFFSAHLGGNQRLPNGNTLITESTSGHLFEVSAAGSVVWQYQHGQEIARSLRYGVDYPGLSAMRDEVTIQQNTPCCYTMSVKNGNIAGKVINELLIEVAPGATIQSGATAPPGWTATLLNPRLLKYSSPGGVSPGATLGGFGLCFDGETGAVDATWKTQNSGTVLASGSWPLTTACIGPDSASVNTGISDRKTCTYEWTLKNRNGAKRPLSVFELSILTPGYAWADVTCPAIAGWNGTLLSDTRARYAATAGMELATAGLLEPFITRLRPPSGASPVAVEWSSWDGGTLVTRDTLMLICSREAPMCDSASVVNESQTAARCTFDFRLDNLHTPSGPLHALRLRLLTPGAVFLLGGGSTRADTNVFDLTASPLASGATRSFPCIVDAAAATGPVRMAWESYTAGAVLCSGQFDLACLPPPKPTCDEYFDSKLIDCDYTTGFNNAHTPVSDVDGYRLRLLTAGASFAGITPPAGWTVTSSTSTTVEFHAASAIANGGSAGDFRFTLTPPAANSPVRLERCTRLGTTDVCPDTVTLQCAPFVKLHDRLNCLVDASACETRFGFENRHTPVSRVDRLSVTVLTAGDTILAASPVFGWVVDSLLPTRVIFRHTGGGIPNGQGAGNLAVSFLPGADDRVSFRWCTMFGNTVLDCTDSILFCTRIERRCDSLGVLPTATACRFVTSFKNLRQPAALVDGAVARITTPGATLVQASAPGDWTITAQDGSHVVFRHNRGGITGNTGQTGFALTLAPPPGATRIALQWCTTSAGGDPCCDSMVVECEKKIELSDTLVFMPDTARPCCGRLMLLNRHTPLSAVTALEVRTLTAGARIMTSHTGTPAGWLPVSTPLVVSWTASGAGLAPGAQLDSCAVCFDNTAIAHADFRIGWESRDAIHTTGADSLLLACTGTVEARLPAALPLRATLDQNYPNPFTGSTTIVYGIERTTDLRLEIVDVSGAVLRTLVSGERAPGRYLVEWKAEGLPSGVYACRLRTRDLVLSRVMVLAR